LHNGGKDILCICTLLFFLPEGRLYYNAQLPAEFHRQVFHFGKKVMKARNFAKVDSDFLFLAKLRRDVARKGTERKKLSQLQCKGFWQLLPCVRAGKY